LQVKVGSNKQMKRRRERSLIRNPNPPPGRRVPPELVLRGGKVVEDKGKTESPKSREVRDPSESSRARRGIGFNS